MKNFIYSLIILFTCGFLYSQKLSPNPQPWFKENLGINIPQNLFSFPKTNYQLPIDSIAKKELSWLLNLIPKSTTRDLGFINVQFKKEDSTVLFILPKYFIASSYKNQNSFIYFPKEKKLTIVDFVAENIELENIIIGYRTFYLSNKKQIVEKGYYDPFENIFVSDPK